MLAKYKDILPSKLKLRMLYKLGLYNKIINNPKYKKYIYYDIAKIATSYNTSNKNNIIPLSSKYMNNMTFILGILPYNPSLALCCLRNDKPCLLRLFILYHLGKTVGNIPSNINHPDLYLLYNNVYLDSNSKIENINKYFSKYNLSEITLINKKDNNFIKNITSKHLSLSELDGLPLVSILVTTFNSEKWIEWSINSLLSQTYNNIEIIIIDDSSTDSTISIIERLERSSSKIKLLKLPKNIGTYAAKNIGCFLAKGEFITCQDSDDWAHPQKIMLQVLPLLENPDLIVTFSQWFRICNNGTAYARNVYPLTRLNPSSALFRKNIVIEKIGLWDCVRTGADSEFNARLKLVFGHELCLTIKKPLTIGTHREGSLMTSDDTGYVNGISLERLNYLEAWTLWHLSEVANKRKPYYLLNNFRPFKVSDKNRVDYRDIMYNIYFIRQGLF
ncbi:Putative lipooligosaccharide biosynthesis protein [Actinobacillus ureae]|uniref:glycosyltransferase family 2 protein n=1 Tax=Actinobacillus ureae TaxID=723 RepID=UPI000E12B1C8|nr:glycosyltransferase family A protein [Actinobacillus ureae]SUT87920.1 Putative lipooligosaccharide biosynthesis protein [Actinobacillus ureae]SUU49710.1 Putative lipooligosaccharide biosynthesis protein [Actinobacillus ureae]